jgi:hypothetical protein
MMVKTTAGRPARLSRCSTVPFPFCPRERVKISAFSDARRFSLMSRFNSLIRGINSLFLRVGNLFVSN